MAASSPKGQSQSHILSLDYKAVVENSSTEDLKSSRGDDVLHKLF